MRRVHLGLLSLLLGTSASAQIVDVQARFPKEAEQGLSGGLEAGFDWRTGSNDYFAVRGAFTAQALVDDHQFMTLVQGEYGTSAGEAILSRTLEHVRYRHHFSETFAAEAFIQHELNLFRRLQLRGLVGAGPRVRYVHGKRFNAAFGVAAMVEHERLRKDDAPDAGELQTNLRLSSYVLARVEPFEGVSLAETVYFQPRADRFSDFRVLNETALVVKASERIGLTLAFLLFYDAQAPALVEPLDTQLRSGVTVSF